MRHCQRRDALGNRAIVQLAVIFKPSGVLCILMQVAGRDVVMLATDHPAKTRKVAFGLIGAVAIERIGFAVINPARREHAVQNIPMRSLVGVNR